MALSIRRAVGEKIYIGDEVVMTIMTLSKDFVSINFEADDTVSIDREEIRVKKLLGQAEDRACKSNRKSRQPLSGEDIRSHIAEVFDLHVKNKNYEESMRFLKLLPGFEIMSDEYLMALLDASYIE